MRNTNKVMVVELVLGVALSLGMNVALHSAGWAKKSKPADPKPSVIGDAMQIQGTAGELDAGQVERLFREHQPELRRCYDDVSSQFHYVGGRMQVKVVVLPSGQIKTVTIPESNIGCREVERCVAGVIEKLHFPVPKGGEGEVTYPFECAARTRVGSWQSERIAAQLGKRRSGITGCKGKAGSAPVSALHATLYVGPGGKATSIGFSADLPLDEKLTSCVSKQLLGVQYDDPLGQMVKVSFDLGNLQTP